jgi:rRNA processing protein Gar1
MLKDELSIDNSTHDQHSNSNHCSQTLSVPIQKEPFLCPLDSQTVSTQQAIPHGLSANLLLSSQTANPLSILEQKLEGVFISDSEDENIDEQQYQKEHALIQKCYQDEDGDINYIPTKNEKLEYEIPTVTHLTADSKVQVLGSVFSIVDDVIVIKKHFGAHIVNLDTTVFKDDSRPLGFILDIIGNIDDPYFVVKVFPNPSDTKQTDISVCKVEVGSEVYYDSANVSYINTHEIIKNSKKTDASNLYDEEADSEEYSDDDKEIQMKKSKKNKTNKTNSIPNNNSQQPLSNQLYNYNKSNLCLKPNQVNPFAAFQQSDK